MIVDAYSNVWQPRGTSDYLTAESYPPERLLSEMSSAGIDMAVICSLGQDIDNPYIASLVSQHADRLIGFGQVDPRDPGMISTITQCAEQLHFRGLKLHPTLHGYHFADHGLMDPVFRAARQYGLAVLVNCLDDPFCAPLAIEEIAKGFPEVPVLLAHMGTVWNVTEAVLVASRTESIYLETSGTQLLEVRMAYEKVGAQKLIMGTDWPGSVFSLERAKIALAVSNDSDRSLVEGGNLTRLLSLGG